MTLEIRSGEGSTVYEDDATISMGQLRRALGFLDAGAVVIASRRTGVQSVPYEYSRSPGATRPPRYRVSDFPKIVEGLALGRSNVSSFCPRDTFKDFQFVSPSGATVIYRYPKK